MGNLYESMRSDLGPETQSQSDSDSDRLGSSLACIYLSFI